MYGSLYYSKQRSQGRTTIGALGEAGKERNAKRLRKATSYKNRSCTE